MPWTHSEKNGERDNFIDVASGELPVAATVAVI